MKNTAHLKHAKVENIGGAPAFTVDGRPISIMAYQWARQEKSRWHLKNMGEAGVELYFIRLRMDDPEKLQQFIDNLHESVRLLKEEVPNALVIPWLIIYPYPGFAEKYPDDVIVFSDGTTGGWRDPKFMGLQDPDTPRFSYASEAWKNEVGGMVREVVRHINDDPELSQSVIGYFFYPMCFECSWFWDYDNKERCMDYSKAMQAAFRNYLIGKYSGMESRLRAAWKDDTVTFATAQVPSFQQRTTTDYGWFWDPRNNAQVLDYAECHSEVVADKLEYFTQICKEESDNKAVTGTFFGYLQNQDFLWGGQSRFKKMMDSPWLDFWVSPYTYENKGPGGYSSMRFLIKSLQQHGKLWLTEADTFIYDAGGLIHHGFPEVDKDQSRELLKRDFVYPLCESTQAWWIDWCCGPSQYQEDGFKPLMRQMQKLGRAYMKMPVGGVSDIAAVVDQESLISTQDLNAITNVANIVIGDIARTEEEVIRQFPSHLMYNAIDRFRTHELPRLGSPVDFYETDDILAENHRKHKMYIFLNAYRMDDYEREGIRKKLQRDGNVLVFMYGAGLIAPSEAEAIGPENVSRITGIRMGVEMENRRARMKICDGASAALPGLLDGAEIGDFERIIDCGFDFRANQRVPFKPAPNRINPVLFVDDPEATPLATYLENGKVGFAMKEFEDWTSVYIGSPGVQAYVLRAIAKKAGAHLYVEGEDIIVYANESFLGIHTATDGERTVRLKQAETVREAFDGRDVGQGITEFKEYIPKESTRLYCYHPELLEE